MGYLKYRMRVIDGEFNPILRASRLFNQWIVDSYLKMEKERINFFVENQNKIQQNQYTSVLNAVTSKASECNATVGSVKILPATFVGSQRYMEQNYQDSMTIVKNFGKPDLFITMTCNFQWPEIQENLLEGQEVSDRPDIVFRVFHQKVQYLINEISKKKIFGEISAYVYTIEFQKRGLPHVHLLINLKSSYKLRNANEINKYISAELPDAKIHPNLYDKVVKHMLHGPCGPRCKKNDKCSRNFPKNFIDETVVEDDGYPKYRRKNDGRLHEKGQNIFTNQHVVPYNPYLLMVMDCHINVEIVGSIKAVKYIYKYIFKGHDRAAFKIDESKKIINYDECKSYSDSRYIGSPEAAWRIFGFSIHAKSHAVIRLPLHLPNGNCTLELDNISNDDIEETQNKKLMLIKYFELNKTNEIAKSLLYSDIPKYFTWHKVEKTWKPRKSFFNVIGRVQTIYPQNVELFHLKILLSNVKGATTYECLKTYNNKTYSTFKDACLARGLIQDDKEIEKIMQEATLPSQLRDLCPHNYEFYL